MHLHQLQKQVVWNYTVLARMNARFYKPGFYMSTNHAAKIDERISLIMAELFTFLLSSVYYGVLRVAGKDPGCVLA